MLAVLAGEFRTLPADMLETVNLTFRAMPSPPSPAELDVLRKQRKWAAILAMTADESIQPRDPALTIYHLEALRFLGLAVIWVAGRFEMVPPLATGQAKADLGPAAVFEPCQSGRRTIQIFTLEVDFLFPAADHCAGP